MGDSSGGESLPEDNRSNPILKHRLRTNKNVVKNTHPDWSEEMDINTEQFNTIENKDSQKSSIEYLSNTAINTNESKNTDINKETMKYEEKDLGPYVVIVQAMNGDMRMGNYHPMAIAQLLIDNKVQGIKSIKRQGANKIAVEHATYLDANNLLKNTDLNEKGYKAFIPYNMISCKGVVRGVAAHFTEEELMKYINAPFPIIGIRRIMRRTNSEEAKKQKATLDNSVTLKPTGTIVVTFKGKMLPRRIQICMIDLEVSPYISPVIICRNCVRYGHTEKQCRGRKRCARCGINDHSKSECEANEPLCVHCKGKHDVFTQDECSEYKRQKAIKELMAFENLSHFDAAKKCSNKVDTRRNEDFPLLPVYYEKEKNQIEPQQRRSVYVQSQKNYNNYSQITKRKRSPSPNTGYNKENTGYNKEKHNLCLMPTPPGPSSAIINEKIYQENIVVRQIEQIEDYFKNDTLSKDDKAIILTILHEIKYKQNEQNKENTKTYSRRIRRDTEPQQ